MFGKSKGEMVTKARDLALRKCKLEGCDQKVNSGPGINYPFCSNKCFHKFEKNEKKGK